MTKLSLLILLASCQQNVVAPKGVDKNRTTTSLSPTSPTAQLPTKPLDEQNIEELKLTFSLSAKRDQQQLSAMRIAAIAKHSQDKRQLSRWRAKLDKSSRSLAPSLYDYVMVDQDSAVATIDIALLLPLTGKYASLGRHYQSSLAAALALDKRKLRVKSYDTGGARSGAMSAVKMAAEAGAKVLIGPIGQQECQAAARAATEHHIPIGLLSPHVHSSGASGVFQLMPSLSWEAREAVRLAKSLGHEHLGIFAPRSALGDEQIRAFRTAAKQYDVKVARAGQYDPSGSDLRQDIKDFIGLNPSTNTRLRRHLRRYGRRKGWKTFSPKVPFEALYIPDTLRSALLAVAHLKYYNVEMKDGYQPDHQTLLKKHGGRIPQLVQLIGASSWHTPNQLVGNHGLEGAVVLDRCPADETSAPSFTRLYQRRTGQQPSQTALELHDVAAVVTGALQPSRTKTLKSLRRGRRGRGACGTFELTTGGKLIREAGLLQIRGSHFDPYFEF